MASLDLVGNEIGPAGAQALARSPHLQHLTHLNLDGNPIGHAMLGEIEREMVRRQGQTRGHGRGT